MQERPNQTEIFDTYWRFTAERQAIYFRRLNGDKSPWTSDSILREYRFTNVYRVLDRVSQYLVAEVQGNLERTKDPEDVFLRTLLFKFFNRIETWEAIERELGPVQASNRFLLRVSSLLDSMYARGESIYSAAYIMPRPAFSRVRKHQNHIALLASMIRDKAAKRVLQAKSLREVFSILRQYRGLGPFLAFQYTIDLNYSSMFDFGEDDFVIAGPGARDGIAKCVADRDVNPEAVIMWACENQEEQFRRLGLTFDGLFGRRLHPVDCQNLFCEVSKYARVAHPSAPSLLNRTKIKQRFRASSRPIPIPRFPARWQLQLIAR